MDCKCYSQYAMEDTSSLGNSSLVKVTFVFAGLACILFLLLWLWPETIRNYVTPQEVVPTVAPEERASIREQLLKARSDEAEIIESAEAHTKTQEIIRAQIISSPETETDPASEDVRNSIRSQLRSL